MYVPKQRKYLNILTDSFTSIPEKTGMVKSGCSLASSSDRHIWERQYETDRKTSFNGWCSSRLSLNTDGSWKNLLSRRCRSCTAVSWVWILGLPTFSMARFSMATWSQGYSLEGNHSLFTKHYLSQPMRLWYLSLRRPVKTQASLRICTFSPEPSLFAHMKYGSKRRARPKIRHLAPLDGCACVFEE